MDYICLIACLSWLTGCLLRLYRGTAERNNNAVILWNNYDIVTTFGANTRTCLYFCHVDYYVLVWLFIVQVHNSFLSQLSLELSHLIDLLILAVLTSLLRQLRQLIYFRIYWWYRWLFLRACSWMPWLMIWHINRNLPSAPFLCLTICSNEQGLPPHSTF